MLRPLPLHWRTLSYSLLVVCLSCLPVATQVRLPPPTSIPTTIPSELRIGKVNVDGDWIRLTPEQASKLAVQVKYLQELADKSYLLGRSEGMVALQVQQREYAYSREQSQKYFLYGIAGTFMLGLGLGLLAEAVQDE